MRLFFFLFYRRFFARLGEKSTVKYRSSTLLPNFLSLSKGRQ